jgi:hypothetical protein
MKIHQISFAYMPIEDRMLFRFNTSDSAEFRLILTRAMSINLLSQIESIIQINLEREYPAVVEDSLRALGDFKRDSAIKNSDYQTPFSSEVATYPIGEQPLLVTGLALSTVDGAPSLGFQLPTNQTLNISLDHDLAQAIKKLFRDNLSAINWGIIFNGQADSAGFSSEINRVMVH